MADAIESLWPSPSVDLLSDTELAGVYAYPGPSAADCWVRANFVASLDGAASFEGRSEPLSSPADKRVFRLLRALSDVILVGAGTVRAEGYGSTHLDIAEHSRLRDPQKPTPPIAVVTRSADLDPAGDLFVHNIVPPLVLTSRAAPRERLRALEAAGAQIVFAGEDEISLTDVLAELAGRGLRKVLCEGGPRLFASLLAIDAVDELCLTVSPTLVGGAAQRISHGPPTQTVAKNMRLASVLCDHDSLLLRYLSR